MFQRCFLNIKHNYEHNGYASYYVVAILSHVRREVAKSNHRRACCGGAGQSWLRHMRHESLGGNRRALAAAWMSFRLPSIP